MSTNGRALEGHVPASHPLSTRTAFKGLGVLTRPLVPATSQSLWEQDTARLPRGQAKRRARARDFADEFLVPAALELDVAPQPPLGEIHPRMREVVSAASRQGFMSDLAFPPPLGTHRPPRPP
jgi:hypothetical protein